MRKFFTHLWLLPLLILVITVVGWLAYTGPTKDTLLMQTGHTQAQLQRWVQTMRRLPCPAANAESGLEDCSLPAEKEFYRGALPWKTLVLPRRYGQSIEYRVPQAYVQDHIFDRMSSQGLCRSGFYPMQTSATEAAFQLYSVASPGSPSHLLAEARRWHLLPHLRLAAAPQLFLSNESGHEIQWFTRCGALTFPQRKQTLPENSSFASTALSLDGTLLATVQGEKTDLWQRQNNRWQRLQAIHENGQRTRQILFSPDNRWFIELTETRNLHLWQQQSRSIATQADGETSTHPAASSYALQPLPADLQAIANAGTLEALSINASNQWMAAFYADGLRFWKRVNGAWTLAEGEISGANHVANRVLQWNSQGQNSAWVLWNGSIRRFWFAPAANNMRPSAILAPAQLGSIHEGSHYLSAPDGSNQLMEMRCDDETLTLTRLAVMGARYLPVAQRSIAKEDDTPCGLFAWETMDEILEIHIKEQSIDRITPPAFLPITHSPAQD